MDSNKLGRFHKIVTTALVDIQFVGFLMTLFERIAEGSSLGLTKREKLNVEYDSVTDVSVSGKY
jgi:hypothetical protein